MTSLGTSTRELSICRQVVRHAWKAWTEATHHDPALHRAYYQSCDVLRDQAICALIRAVWADRPIVSKTIIRIYL